VALQKLGRVDDAKERFRQALVADPTDSQQIYLSLSYPTAVYHLTNQSWQSLTPPAS